MIKKVPLLRATLRFQPPAADVQFDHFERLGTYPLCTAMRADHNPPLPFQNEAKETPDDSVSGCEVVPVQGQVLPCCTLPFFLSGLDLPSIGLLFGQIFCLSQVLPNCRHEALGNSEGILCLVETYRVDSLVVVYLSQLESMMQVK